MVHFCGQHSKITLGLESEKKEHYKSIDSNEGSANSSNSLIPIGLKQESFLGSFENSEKHLYSAYLGNVEIKVDKFGDNYYLQTDYVNPENGEKIMVKVIDAKAYGINVDYYYNVDQLSKLNPMLLDIDENKYQYFVGLHASLKLSGMDRDFKRHMNISRKLAQFRNDEDNFSDIRDRAKKEFPGLFSSRRLSKNYYKRIYRKSLLHNSPVDVLFDVYNYVEFLHKEVGMFGIIDKPYLIAIANVDNLDNAFWTGDYMVFGNGRSAFYPLSSLDVCGHELGHGVVQRLAGLEYKQHSGALNESFADILGTEFEFWMYDKFNLDKSLENNLLGKADYFIGEDLTISDKYLRNMENPQDGMSPQPSKYQGAYYYNPNGSADYGGVHINSGIPNHCYYLMAKLCGRKVAFKIFISCLEQLSPNATFIEFRDKIINLADAANVRNNTKHSIRYSLKTVGLHENAISDVGYGNKSSSNQGVKRPRESQDIDLIDLTKKINEANEEYKKDKDNESWRPVPKYVHSMGPRHPK